MKLGLNFMPPNQSLGRTCLGFDKMARLIDSNAPRCVTCVISS